MTAQALPIRLPDRTVARVAVAVTGMAFLVLFAQPLGNTGRTWWTDPEAGHGLLLAPLAFILAWRQGIRPDVRANTGLGIGLLVL